MAKLFFCQELSTYLGWPRATAFGTKTKIDAKEMAAMDPHSAKTER
jgi:hypothetical protein